MPINYLIVNTDGESFVDITEKVRLSSKELCQEKEGLLYLFIQHTSCALTINESFDPSAKVDLENFMKHMAPRNLPFITHTSEGEDDSPSHMKSILLNQNLIIPIVHGQMELGQWQGIYLAEFRDFKKQRKILLKFIEG